ncbi:MAG TPA: CPBP family intramembrane glutamic endopeptidase [bacterium]|nr:CPBP family intramembrane glutamic endopeptidase [bacterium]
MSTVRTWQAVLVGILGCVALAARPAAVRGAPLVDLAIGIVGVTGVVPATTDQPSGWPRWAAAVALGVATFAAGRVLVPVHPPHLPLSAWGVAVLMVASVAEEAFFRRWLYGWLAAGGVTLALVGTATAFAAVHVPAYGVRALPIDFAAGLLFGWQRLATGGWTAPAVTHMAANLLQVG